MKTKKSLQIIQRSDANRSQIIGGDAGANHSQIIGGIYLPSPRVSAPIQLHKNEIISLSPWLRDVSAERDNLEHDVTAAVKETVCAAEKAALTP